MIPDSKFMIFGKEGTGELRLQFNIYWHQHLVVGFNFSRCQHRNLFFSPISAPDSTLLLSAPENEKLADVKNLSAKRALC